MQAFPWNFIADHVASGAVVAVVGTGLKIIHHKMNGLATKEYVKNVLNATVKDNNVELVRLINGTYVKSETQNVKNADFQRQIDDLKRSSGK